MSYTGKSRLLVMLFAILSYITLCLSAPESAINYEKWKKINTDLENGIRVDMNDEKFEEFNGAGGKKAFGSSGFDSCFGVLIAAEAKKNIPGLYKQHEDKLSGSTAYLYVSVDAYAPEQFLDQELTTRMINMFKNELQMNPHIVRYTEASALVMDKNGEIRECFEGAEMEGRLLVIGGGGKKPQVDFVTQDMQLNP